MHWADSPAWWEKTHQEGNQISLSHKSCLPVLKKMHKFFWRLPESVSSCYNSLVHASEVLMLAGLFTYFTGCFSSRGCDVSHRTHQSWENPSCSGSKNHSSSCSRYDIKWKCEVIAYWLQISMVLSFMRSYQEQKRFLPKPTFENTQISSGNSSSHNTEVWKSVWAFNSCINLEQ